MVTGNTGATAEPVAGAGSAAPVAPGAQLDLVEPEAAVATRSRADLGNLLAFAVPAGIVFVVCLGLYLRTLLTDVAFWDTGEFQAVGPVLGIAHPTGYPTYTLLAWLASVVLQPFGNPAYRADLLSALLVSGAAALTSVLLVQLTRRPIIALAAGLLLGTCPLAWGQLALVADPHALHLFFAALMLVLLVGWMQRHRAGDARAGRWLFAAAIAFGLSLGNHALTLLLAPGIAVFVLVVDPRILWRRTRLVVACTAAVVLTTVAVYAYIPIRASMNPPMDYAKPVTWEAFRYLVLGEQFRGTFHAMPSLHDGLLMIWDEMVANLGIAAWLALAGVFLSTLRSAAFTILSVLWFALTFAFALGYENASIERYYMVPLLIAVIWAALAVDAAWTAIVSIWSSTVGRSRAVDVPPTPPRPGSSDGAAAAHGVPGTGRIAVMALAGVMLIVPILVQVPDRLTAVDQSADHSAGDWMRATFRALDPNAVLVSWWSFSTALWYGQFVDGLRPDVTIIDDRTIIDDGYLDAQGNPSAHVAIDTYLGSRPVYLIRTSYDLPQFAADYTLTRVAEIPGTDGGAVYRVTPKNAATPP